MEQHQLSCAAQLLAISPSKRLKQITAIARVAADSPMRKPIAVATDVAGGESHQGSVAIDVGENGQWRWGRRASGADITRLIGMTLAADGAQDGGSIYETRGPLFL